MHSPQYRLHAIARIEIENEFPSLRGTPWEIRSPFNRSYNCHAWGVCETRVRWEPTPDDYWPPGLRTGNFSDYSLDNFVRAYSRVGFRVCSSSRFEFGFQKIAIYSEYDSGDEWPQHTARQAVFGRGWLSKLGDGEDITHLRTMHLEGASYGRVVCYMRRNWLRAVLDPCSTWISASIRNWIYKAQRPHGV